MTDNPFAPTPPKKAAPEPKSDAGANPFVPNENPKKAQKPKADPPKNEELEAIEAAERAAQQDELAAVDELLETLPEEDTGSDFSTVIIPLLKGFLRTIFIIGALGFGLWLIWSSGDDAPSASEKTAPSVVARTADEPAKEGFLKRMQNRFAPSETEPAPVAATAPETPKVPIAPSANEPEESRLVARLRDRFNNMKSEEDVAPPTVKPAEDAPESEGFLARMKARIGGALSSDSPNETATDGASNGPTNPFLGEQTVTTDDVFTERRRPKLSNSGTTAGTANATTAKSNPATAAQNPITTTIALHEWVQRQAAPPVIDTAAAGSLEQGMRLLQALQQLFEVPMISYVTAETETARRGKIDSFLSYLKGLKTQSSQLAGTLSAEFDGLINTEKTLQEAVNASRAQITSLLNNAAPGQLDQLIATHADAKNKAYATSAQAEARRVVVGRLRNYVSAIEAIEQNLKQNRRAIEADVQVYASEADPFQRVLSPAEWRAQAR